MPLRTGGGDRHAAGVWGGHARRARLRLSRGAADPRSVIPFHTERDLGIFSIDPTTLAVTERVPSTLGTAAWANGASSTGSLVSSGLLWVPGNVTPIDGHFAYERTMNDGSTIMFAGTLLSGPASELALFEIPPSATLVPFPQEPGSDLLAWQLQDSASQEASLFVWDDGHRQFITCHLPAPIDPVDIASPDGTKILFGATTPWDLLDPGGPLVLVSLGLTGQGSSGTCTLLVSANTTNAEFSSDGSELFWLTGEALWTAADDGSGARLIGSGNVFQPEFGSGTKLYFYFDEPESEFDFVWVDTADTSNTLTTSSSTPPWEPSTSIRVTATAKEPGSSFATTSILRIRWAPWVS